ncbi:hypothetical protein B0T21DRAFT_409534 [Apiosordaria backusii]|uniref:Uncharacterized protein n=1 Tax=Apiosordaria backusii TaxID=314023 RepID=A0AA40BRQ7_9PEZI|nr:hypothetical protein B0T21DRAFT_409534 [Apiosordaria backusii]
MNYHQARKVDPNHPGDNNENRNKAVFVDPSMPAGNYHTYVDHDLNHHHQHHPYHVNPRFRNVTHLTVAPAPAPAIRNDRIFNAATLGVNFAMNQQHAVPSGGLPPPPPEGVGSTAPLQAVIAGSANPRSPHLGPFSDTPKAHAIPEKVMIQVKGKWFVALVSDNQVSIMDRDFAERFLELEAMPFPGRRQLQEIASVTDGHSSGPKDFATFNATIPSLELDNWKVNVALLPDTWKHQPAPLLLGQSFFERLAREHGSTSHRSNESQLQRQIASIPSIQSINRMTSHAMHHASTTGVPSSVAFGGRASSTGVNNVFNGSQTVNPRDIYNKPQSSYFDGSAPPGADDFS